MVIHRHPIDKVRKSCIMNNVKCKLPLCPEEAPRHMPCCSWLHKRLWWGIETRGRDILFDADYNAWEAFSMRDSLRNFYSLEQLL